MYRYAVVARKLYDKHHVSIGGKQSGGFVTLHFTAGLVLYSRGAHTARVYGLAWRAVLPNDIGRVRVYICNPVYGVLL